MLDPEISLLIHFTEPTAFIEKIIRTGSKAHLLYPVVDHKPFIELLRKTELYNEEEAYSKQVFLGYRKN